MASLRTVSCSIGVDAVGRPFFLCVRPLLCAPAGCRHFDKPGSLAPRVGTVQVFYGSCRLYLPCLRFDPRCSCLQEDPTRPLAYFSLGGRGTARVLLVDFVLIAPMGASLVGPPGPLLPLPKRGAELSVRMAFGSFPPSGLPRNPFSQRLVGLLPPHDLPIPI